MKTSCVLIPLVVMIVGCGPQGEPGLRKDPPQPITKVSQSEEAKAHIQQYIDRLMGGDQSVKMGLLGLDGVDFNTIESLEIKSALPAYLPDGKKVDNMIKVQINIKGYDNIKRRNIEKNCDKDVYLQDGKWKILGSDL